jgi:anti-anti-sigma factor
MEALHLPRNVPLRSPAPPPATLDMSISRRGDVVELALAGDLDLATAHILREAMTWLHFAQTPGQTIVIDTRSLEFVAVAGYRALRAAMVRTDGTPDPGVACIVGPVVARFESVLGSALAGSGR